MYSVNSCSATRVERRSRKGMSAAACSLPHAGLQISILLQLTQVCPSILSYDTSMRCGAAFARSMHALCCYSHLCCILEFCNAACFAAQVKHSSILSCDTSISCCSCLCQLHTCAVWLLLLMLLCCALQCSKTLFHSPQVSSCTCLHLYTVTLL